MPGEATRLGPFTGGLNTLSDPTSLSDTELVDCVNLELDLDGSLYSRPPIIEHDPAAFAGANVRHLGFYQFGGAVYHIASAGSTTAWSTDGQNWTVITALFAASVMVQYDNKAWLINPTGAGGYWTSAGGFIAVAAMPSGRAAVMLKERMYIVGNATNPSRLFWSNITNPTLWTVGTDFADVDPGDGEILIDIVVFNDNLVIFKNDSTYSFPFDVGPSTGTLRRISSTIGATKRDCVVQYEQNLYVYHEGNVYEIVNYDFSRINTKVPFFYDPTSPSAFSDEVFLCLVGDRIVCRYYNRVYVFGLRTRTWTRWASTIYFGPLRGAPVNTTAAVNNPYYGGACVTGSTAIYKLEDGYGTPSEAMSCYIKTKNYDLSISHKFKRLFWWGADVAAGGTVEGTVTPVVYSFISTWNQLSAFTWDQLFTWAQPLSEAGGITDSVPATLGGGSRKFIKFLKSIRFRQVNFMVSMDTNGTSANAPVRIFTLTAFINNKQDVSQQIS